MDRAHDGSPSRTSNIIYEFTRESLAIRVKRNLKSEDVLECLTELFCEKGTPDYNRSDNGSEYTQSKRGNGCMN